MVENSGGVYPSEPGKPEADFAAPFLEMAAKIDRNLKADFAGAFVIVAPDGSVASLLTLDPSASPVIMWSNIQTKAEMMLREVKDAEEQKTSTGFSHRR